MKLRFANDAEYEAFLAEVKARLDAQERRRLEKPEFAPAAVLMLFMNKGGEAHVLLTRRTSKVATHKGEVAFPGGKRDDGDADTLRTALRETEEEVGIGAGAIRVLGEFDHYFSIWGFHVSTWVGAIPYPCEYTINRDELDACFEAPLSLFYEEKYYRSEVFNFEGRDVTVYYYHYDGFEIWGLTARILTDFARKILKD
ncbi:MAG TPA: CoA pyrophosphatase [Spirochaetota bacterium]|nr:CoA pyrophosphatase [Spirochaetota bacterium]